MRLGLQPVAAYYTAGVLLTNCYTFIRSNQISDQFVCSPPSLHEYLRLNHINQGTCRTFVKSRLCFDDLAPQQVFVLIDLAVEHDPF